MAEAEVEAVRQRLAGRPRALRRVAGALDDVGRGVVERAAGDPGPRGGACRLERLADDVAQRGDLVASPRRRRTCGSCRPSSRCASSRGHRSIVIGRSAGSGPEPGSWPPPDQRGDDHDVRRRGRARRGARARGSPRARLGGQGAPSGSRPPRAPAPRISRSAAAMPASAARWARRMPVELGRVFTRRRALTAARVDGRARCPRRGAGRRPRPAGRPGRPRRRCPTPKRPDDVSSSASSSDLPASSSSKYPSSSKVTISAVRQHAAIRPARACW